MRSVTYGALLTVFLASAGTVGFITTISYPAFSQSIDKTTLYKAHVQFYERMTNKRTPWRSSYLPRVGDTKGADYRNCVDKGFWKSTNPKKYKDFDSNTFCSWHAEIGRFSR